MSGVISAVAFCPHPPLLVPAVAAGAAGELDELRAACHDAVRAVAASAGELVLLGSGPERRTYAAGARGTLRPYGVAVETSLGPPGTAPPVLPLSLTIGAWLVADAAPPCPVRAEAVTADDGELEITGDVGLIVLGDGSARRSRTAPGYLDERAAPFDAAVAAALAAGDPATLAGLDAVLGADLLAAGVPAWRAAGRLLAGARWRARLRYDDAPYGVGYLVADWQRDG
jgi:hypothetical protein